MCVPLCWSLYSLLWLKFVSSASIDLGFKFYDLSWSKFQPHAKEVGTTRRIRIYVCHRCVNHDICIVSLCALRRFFLFFLIWVSQWAWAIATDTPSSSGSSKSLPIFPFCSRFLSLVDHIFWRLVLFFWLSHRPDTTHSSIHIHRALRSMHSVPTIIYIPLNNTFSCEVDIESHCMYESVHLISESKYVEWTECTGC